MLEHTFESRARIGCMTRPDHQLAQAKELIVGGVSQAETARRLGIPRSTIRTWLANGFVHPAVNKSRRAVPGVCSSCRHIDGMTDPRAYAYLLGMYLGDGNIATYPRGVYRLRITCDQRYPGIIAESELAMRAVLPNRVGCTPRVGCTDVASYSKHWPCLLPQHGSGPKHMRSIVLERWQHDIAIVRHPKAFLRGLVHSDGWRGTNVAVTARGRYYYPRYEFSNRSLDIQALFASACAQIGVACRQANRWNLAVSRRADVALLDEFIGPKR